jgi:hypothetical protein
VEYENNFLDVVIKDSLKTREEGMVRKIFDGKPTSVELAISVAAPRNPVCSRLASWSAAARENAAAPRSNYRCRRRLWEILNATLFRGQAARTPVVEHR